MAYWELYELCYKVRSISDADKEREEERETARDGAGPMRPKATNEEMKWASKLLNEESINTKSECNMSDEIVLVKNGAGNV